MNSQKSIHYTAFDIAIGTASLAILYLLSLYNYLLFHALAEFYSIGICVCIFFIGWNLKSAIHNNYLIYISTAYLFVGILDLVHTLSFRGMSIFQDYDFYANQIWIATRFLEAVTLCVGFYLARDARKINSNLVFLIYTAVTSGILLSIFYWKCFPVCFVEGVGLTEFKICSEYAICLLLTFSLYLLYRNKNLFSPDIYRLMQTSICFTVVSELAFTIYSDNYGLANLIGHYFKIFSFYAIYRALIKTGISEPYKLYLKHLKDANDSLHKQALAMENQVKYFNAVFNNSEVGILVTADGTISDCNAKLLRITGFEARDLLGKELSSVRHFGAIQRVLADAFPDPASHTLESTEATLHSCDNRVVWVSLSVKRYFDTQTQREMVVCVIEDIDSRKQLEFLKEDVERIVRHDLVSPLNGILSILNLLEEEQTMEPDEVQSYQALMKKSAERMLRLVRSSSELYKIEKKTYEISLQEVELVALIADIETELQEVIDRKGLTIMHLTEERLDPGHEFSVCGDHFLLFELFSNLILNAVEASSPGDTIHIFFCHENRSKKIQLFNAHPVPHAIVDRFFDKYVTAKKFGGTGLGTYIARMLTEAHKGTIALETDEAYGTIISVTLSCDCLLDEQARQAP